MKHVPLWFMVLMLAIVTGVLLGPRIFQVAEAQTLAVGQHGNAWNASTVLVAGTSTAIDTNRCQSGYSSAFGNASLATTLTVQYSQNNVNFYSSGSTVAANGNFALAFTHGARYVRLLSSAAAVITATIACK